jgi:protein-S-isoprenylcysteine O-methyltransferase Ste14
MPASIVLIFIGLAVRALAIFTLGKSFSANVAIRDSQKIYRGGLYRFLRHPSYLGLILIFLAIGLHSRNWLCLAIAFLPTTAALLYRIHIEEAALRNAFAEDYASYSKVTKRLIPGIY